MFVRIELRGISGHLCSIRRPRDSISEGYLVAKIVTATNWVCEELALVRDKKIITIKGIVALVHAGHQSLDVLLVRRHSLQAVWLARVQQWKTCGLKFAPLNIRNNE